MSKKLYIGSLPYSVTDEELAKIFAEVGTVESARVIMDRDSGRSKGFGFVEMSTEAEAQEAIKVLNGATVENRQMAVSLARPQTERRPGGGFGGGRSGGGRGGFGGGRNQSDSWK